MARSWRNWTPPGIVQALAQGVARANEAGAAQDLAAKTAARWVEMMRIKVISVQEADERASELALRTAQLESARADVRRLESLPGFARITSPFAGTVTARRLDIGQLVIPPRRRSCTGWHRRERCACLCACRRVSPPASRPV